MYSLGGQGFELELVHRATFANLRVLAWYGELLYASRGYGLLRADMRQASIRWDPVASFRPALWRNLTSQSHLTARLCRDGFHALTVLRSGGIVAVVPGAIVRCPPGEKQFRLSHRITRGTRPLHIVAAPNEHLFWGEYFDNPQRDEVHIFASTDGGAHWDVAHTFARGAIRHVHNIVYDEWEKCFWVLTGDAGDECRILRAPCDFSRVDIVLAGKQQARAVALIPAEDFLYFASDTSFEQNHIYRMDRRGNVAPVADLPGSSIYGSRVGSAIFFSTMVEPSKVNLDANVWLMGSSDAREWRQCTQWRKDRWPMHLFQYGTAILPDGRNKTDLLAATAVAVEKNDMRTTVWRVGQAAHRHPSPG